MTTEQIIIVFESCVIVGLLICLLTLVFKKKKSKPEGNNKGDNVKVVKGVRYTEDDNETKPNGDVCVTHIKGDIILQCNKTYTVSKKGPILPGKYTILSDRDNVTKINVRLDGFVREYQHQTDIVLAEDDTICPVSHSIILR